MCGLAALINVPVLCKHYRNSLSPVVALDAEFRETAPVQATTLLLLADAMLACVQQTCSQCLVPITTVRGSGQYRSTDHGHDEKPGDNNTCNKDYVPSAATSGAAFSLVAAALSPLDREQKLH